MGNVIELRVPTTEDGGTHAFVDRWLKSVGDHLTENEPLVELSTDKISVEVPSPIEGTLIEITQEEGAEVTPGTLLGRVQSAESTAPEGSASSPPPGPGTTRTGPRYAAALSPAVRRILDKHDIDPAQIVGTGAEGRVTYQDVVDYIELMRGAAAPSMPSRRIPHTPMRMQIARHMVESVHTAPHVTAAFEANFSAVLAHRQKYRAPFEESSVHLTVTPYLVHAAVQALRAVPAVNSRWHDDALEIFDDCNIGVATALERRGEPTRRGEIRRGLIVPVLQGAQNLSLFETAERMQRLVEAARQGTLLRRHVQDGTFTISNHGVSGSLFATPVINQPQSAILGVGKVERRLVLPDGSDEPVVRAVGYVTLTIDHRCLDGLEANMFLQAYVAAIESWTPDDDPYERPILRGEP